MKTIIDNPFSQPIKQIIDKIQHLNWEPVYSIPSGITFLALSMVFIIFILLWPYGLIPIITSFLWNLIEDNVKDIKYKNIFEAMPNTIAIGIYFLVWLPFFVIAFPIYTIGFIGKYFSENSSVIK